MSPRGSWLECLLFRAWSSFEECGAFRRWGLAGGRGEPLKAAVWPLLPTDLDFLVLWKVNVTARVPATMLFQS